MVLVWIISQKSYWQFYWNLKFRSLTRLKWKTNSAVENWRTSLKNLFCAIRKAILAPSIFRSVTILSQALYKNWSNVLGQHNLILTCWLVKYDSSMYSSILMQKKTVFFTEILKTESLRVYLLCCIQSCITSIMEKAPLGSPSLLWQWFCCSSAPLEPRGKRADRPLQILAVIYLS